MPKVIAFSRPDGRVSIVVPAPRAKLADESWDKFLSRVIAGAVPNDAPWAILEDSEIPADDLAPRDLWRLVNGKVVVQADG